MKEELIMDTKERLIVALDLAERERVLGLVSQLHDCCGMFKVGLEPFCNYGPAFVKEIQEAGGVFFSI